jgi:tryptophanyl-tRNA synthetase
LNLFLEPIRERRLSFENEKGLVEEILYRGTNKMNEIAAETMKAVHQAMGVAGTWKKISRVARERQNAV